MSESADEGGSKPNPLVRVLQALTPAPIRRNFAVKFGLVLVIMAVSIGGIGFMATEQISAETQGNVETEFQGVAQAESDIIREWVQRNELSTRLLSISEAWGEDASTIEDRLGTEHASLATDVLQMHVVEDTQQGPAIAGSTSLDQGELLADGSRGYFAENMDEMRGMRTRGVYRTDTYRVRGDEVVGFVSPTAVHDGRYLLIEVSISDIQNSLQGSEEQHRGFTRVVNEDGVVMMDASGQGETLNDYTTDDAARRPLEAAIELRETDQRAGVIAEMQPSNIVDETYTVGYSPVEDSNWVVVTHAPRSAVFGFVQTISQWGLFATIGAVLLIGITGAILGYSTSTSIDRLTSKTEQMREGNLDVSFQTSRIDNVGRLYDGFAEMRDALQEQIDEAERARKEAEVSRAEAMEMSNYLQEKAQEYSEIMQQCGEGDLTQRMRRDGENESMDRIAAEFNDMIEELEKTTGQLKSYVDEVEEAGAEVERSASTVRQASEQVADSIQMISDDAYDQKERLQDISETMDDVATSLEEFAHQHPDIDFDRPLGRIKTIAAQLEETAELSESTMAESENVAGAAEEQAAELNEVGERAHDLQRYAQPLRDILNRFETEAKHEFVFSVGPTGGNATPSRTEEGDADDTDDEQV